MTKLASQLYCAWHSNQYIRDHFQDGGQDYPFNLQWTEVNITSDDDCFKAYEPVQGLDFDDDTMVCAFAPVSIIAIITLSYTVCMISDLYSRELILVKEIVVDRLLAMANSRGWYLLALVVPMLIFLVFTLGFSITRTGLQAIWIQKKQQPKNTQLQVLHQFPC